MREYVINPYHMAAREGKYYLICNYNKYDDVTNYRIDRICDIEILDEATKPFESLPESNGRRLDIRDYINCKFSLCICAVVKRSYINTCITGIKVV